jgi:hypothetical protein
MTGQRKPSLKIMEQKILRKIYGPKKIKMAEESKLMMNCRLCTEIMYQIL